MISINIIAVGNLKEKFWREASEEYQKRLSKFCKLKIIELPEQNKYEDTEKILQTEGQTILKAVKECGGKTYLLAIDGKEYSSENLSKNIMQDSMTNSTINFVIGGSYGTSKEVQEGIKDKISFGRATYPHNLARIILLEQVYRSFMLAGGGKYHK
ncbi:MAG: 23S rRNA (pseudouridine(1915)-N(3))-methyltransferase RlmH [Clostridia bacterium]|nr:23S rRNA (pseudouridine(1915)-N(3))-methyltransferase RlmH [Clostridia bacterium]